MIHVRDFYFQVGVTKIRLTLLSEKMIKQAIILEISNVLEISKNGKSWK